MPKQLFEAATLDEASKERLCRDLLAEFGAANIRKSEHRGELIHSCCLPFGKHRNGDRNPSASLNYQKLTFNCLGCGSSGGLLWFIAVCRGEDGPAARKWLEEQTGTGRTVMDLTALLRTIDEMYSQTATAPPPIPTYAESVLDPWSFIHPYMTDGLPEYGVPGRGIPEGTLLRFRVGYAEEYYMGRTEEGVPLPTQERIIIPHFWRGLLVGWQARAISKLDEPKYKSTPDFPKDSTFFNWEPGQRSILVESPLSTLRHFHHQPGMTASFGAKVTDRQKVILQRARELILWMDNDEAGWRSTETLIEEMSPFLRVRVVDSDLDADPADLDDDTVDELIEQAVPWGTWQRPKRLQEVGA